MQSERADNDMIPKIAAMMFKMESVEREQLYPLIVQAAEKSGERNSLVAMLFQAFNRMHENRSFEEQSLAYRICDSLLKTILKPNRS